MIRSAIAGGGGLLAGVMLMLGLAGGAVVENQAGVVEEIRPASPSFDALDFCRKALTVTYTPNSENGGNTAIARNGLEELHWQDTPVLNNVGEYFKGKDSEPVLIESAEAMACLRTAK